MDHPKSNYERGDYLQYGPKIYKVLEIHLKTVTVAQVTKTGLANHSSNLLIDSVNKYGKHLGQNLDVVRMLYL